MIGSGERTGDAQVHQSVEPLEKVDLRAQPAPRPTDPPAAPQLPAVAAPTSGRHPNDRFL